MADDKIIERIKTLLAMAGDTASPHEASIAAGRARKLMDQHQVKLADLTDDGGFGFREVDKEYRYMPLYRNWLTLAVAQYNDCKSVATRKYKSTNNSYTFQIVYQGYENDVLCAIAMYDYLIDTIDRLCAAYIAPMGYSRYPAKIGDAFKKEASAELCQRLRAMLKERTEAVEFQTKTGTSLVLFKMAAVEAEFGKQTIKMTKYKVRTEDVVNATRAAGRKAGAAMPLHREVS
jgi:Protein of unknown function (DUF2786)